MKILAIAQNYTAHNKELNSKHPTEPIVFMKPDSAILKSNKPFYIPDFSNDVHYEVELIVKFNRLGKNIDSKFASRYFSEIGLGIDFTARDLQQQLKTEGRPWEICKAFDNSAVIGEFISVSELGDIQKISFRLDINGKTVQQGNSADMIFPISELVSHISRYFTIKIGDILFTGTPVGVGPVKIGDRLEGYILDKKMFDFYVK